MLVRSHATALSLFRDVFSAFPHPQTLRAEPWRDALRIRCTVEPFSVNERDATFIHLSWSRQERHLCICQLHVATAFRRRGLGKSLVVASERLASQLDARRIHVFPLRRARGFWLAVGYQPLEHAARVLAKIPVAPPSLPLRPPRTERRWP
jgi:GNAT superfamily N-acetyltransferase